MTKWFAGLLLLTTGVYCCFVPQANSSGVDSSLEVQVEGLQEAKGQICYSLFDLFLL